MRMSPSDFQARCRECSSLAESGAPLSPDELAEQLSLRAREMARAEARRQPPQPQLDLDSAA